MALDFARLIPAAITEIDGLNETDRTILCCLLGTSNRQRVAEEVARITAEAIKLELVDASPLAEAIRDVLTVYIEAHIADNDHEYYRDLPGDSPR